MIFSVYYGTSFMKHYHSQSWESEVKKKKKKITCKNNIFNNFGISNMLTSAKVSMLKAEQKKKFYIKIPISNNQNMTFTKQNKM